MGEKWTKPCINKSKNKKKLKNKNKNKNFMNRTPIAQQLREKISK
jgi:hypothetical protein